MSAQPSEPIVREVAGLDELANALREVINRAPNEVDLSRLLEFSGLDDISELRLKVQLFGFAMEKARETLAKAGAK